MRNNVKNIKKVITRLTLTGVS